VKLLDILERSVERVIHSPIDSVFRQKLQPAEIERRLERAMIDNSQRASGSTIMPNRYSVKLSEHDFASVEPFLASLTRRLESWLADRAEAHQGTLLDRLQVEIIASADVKRRRPLIEASISDIETSGPPDRDRSSRPASDHTQMFRVVRSHADVSLRVLTGDQAGTRFSLDQGRSILGRSHDVDIRVDAPDVSRRHLRITRDGKTIRIVDLDSTNGTRVNGEAVTSATLRNGDELLVGAQALRLVIEP
jgi:hypothetical protein